MKKGSEKRGLLHEKAAILTVFVLILAAVGATYFATATYYKDLLSQFRPLFAEGVSYKFVRPLLGVRLPSDLAPDGFGDMRAAVESTIAAQPADTITRYGFYFRDLNTANWTGINEDALFNPASLLKVIVAIAAYRQNENHPGFMSAQLTYTTAVDQINQQLAFALPTNLKVGQSYSVQYLIKAELANSDNGAAYLLLSAINDQELVSVYTELSIPQPNATSSLGYKISPREYSRFFRILYNGTPNLSWENSDRILSDLSLSAFTSGLIAGVPKGIVVAHKYGEHVDGVNGVATGVELADCGIIYYPEQPYFLCVMTEGKDPQALANVIAQVSKSVYQNVDARYR